MTDDNQPEKIINIESNVNVGTASGKTSVSGAKVSVGSARDVHIHGDTTPQPTLRGLLVLNILTLLGAVLINYATSLPLPEIVKPYLWLTWPMLLIVAAASFWVAYRQSRGIGSSVTIGSTLDDPNRAGILDKVENFWIKTVLEQSLYQIARLELGLEQAPEKIDHPWQTIVQQATTTRVVPVGTSVIELFDNLDGKLLILGAPGGGKTTLLLELARDLIARARSDPQHPIPLVFNLSTWASNQKAFDKWLVHELYQRYEIPTKLAQMWMEADAILPLLDGLDEVAAELRDACVEAINTYRKEHGMVSLAVCSRVEEYDQLTDKLKLPGAVAIQPLTPQTVEGYLRQVGRPLAAVRTALKDDPMLRELLDNPLILSIVALAYKDKTPAKLRAVGTLEERRRQLFDDYIAAMFARRGKETRYPQEQTRHWLAWLAGQMEQHNHTVFYIEQMQPNWLPPVQRQGYRSHVRLFSGLVFGLVYGLILGLFSGLVFGLVVGLAGGLFSELSDRLRGRLVSEQGRSFEHIKITETLHWSWSRDVQLVGLFSGLFSGLVFGQSFGLLYGLLLGLLYGLLLGLLFGLGGTELKVKATPNQGIHRSFRNWLLYGLILGLLFGLAGGQYDRRFGGLGTGLRFGPFLGLVVGLDYGGRAVCQHYTLRWLLYRRGFLPLRLVPFLDHCAERIFLRKVGGGYIFVHRLLMEHFASLYTEQPAAPPK